MNPKLSKKIREYLEQKKKDKAWTRVVLAMALAVVCITVYLLMTPAVSMTADTENGVTDVTQADVEDTDVFTQAWCTTTEKTQPDQSNDVSVQTVQLDHIVGMVVEQNTDNGAAVQTEPAKLDSYLAGVTGSGTKYNKNTGEFTTDLRLEFKIPTEDIEKANRKFTYKFPEGVIVPDSLLGTSHKAYDSNTFAFDYEYVKNADGTYSINVVYDETYVENAGDYVDNFIEFSGGLKKETYTDTGKIEISFKDNQTLEIPTDQIDFPSDETVHYDINVSKSGNFVKENNKIKYKIEITSRKGTPSPISLKDVLEANGLPLDALKNVRVSREEVKYYNGWSQGTGKVEDLVNGTDYSCSIDGGNMNMTINKGLTATQPEGADYVLGQKYVIEYEYTLNDLEQDATYKPKNKVEVEGKDETTGEIVKKDTTAEVDVSKKSTSIGKNGYYDNNTGEIVWTITVNNEKNDITGAMVTDEMFAGLSEGELSISPANGYTIEKDESGKITGIKFTAADNGVNKNTYTIRYRQKVTEEWGKNEYTNEAGFKDTDGSGKDVTGKTTVDIGNVEKKLENTTDNKDGTKTLQWKSTAVVPKDGIPAGTKITDELTSNDGKSDTHYMTYAQINEWASKIGNADGWWKKVKELRVKDISGNWYDWTDVASDTTLKFKAFEYTVADKIMQTDVTGDKIEFAYNSTLDTTDLSGGDYYYTNTIKIGEKSSSSSYNYVKGRVWKTDENNRTDTSNTVSDGTLVWKVNTYLDKEYDTITVTDTLPKGVKLSGLIVSDGNGNKVQNVDLMISENGTISSNDQEVKISGKVTENTDGTTTITVNFEKIQGKDWWYMKPKSTLTLKYTCEVDKDQLEDYEAGKTYTFTNHATVKTGEKEYGGADQTQNWTEKKTQQDSKEVSKGATWDNTNKRIDYSIVLNGEGKDLLPGKDTVLLDDILEYNRWNDNTLTATLIPSSVKLYYAKTGTDGKLVKDREVEAGKWSWKYEEIKPEYNADKEFKKVIHAEIPDSEKLILEYAYNIYVELEKGATKYPSIKNTAKLYGETEYTDSKDNTVKYEWAETQGGASTDRKYILYKVEKDKYQNLLLNARFALWKYDGGKFVKTDKVYATDKNGRITIAWQSDNSSDYQFEYNTAYYLEEESAPDGYQMPVDPVKCAFYFSSSSSENNQMPDKFVEEYEAVDLSSSGKTAFVENEGVPTTNVTAQKVWKDKDGNDIPDDRKPGSVTVKLWRYVLNDEQWKQANGESSGSSSGGTGSGENVTLHFDIKNAADQALNSIYSDTGSQINSSGYTCPAGSEITVKLTNKSGQWESLTSRDFYVGTDKYTVQRKALNGGASEYTLQFKLNSDTTLSVACTDWSNNFDSDFSCVVSSVPPTPSNDNTNTGDDSTDDFDWSTVIKELYPGESGEQTLSQGNNWKHEWSNLPSEGTDSDGNHVYYKYFVEEVSVEGYDTSISASQTENGWLYTVENRKNKDESYTLPETGGPGGTMYTIGGLLLAVGAAFILWYRHILKIRREGRLSSRR